jgi:hypothetical protein
MIWKSKGIPEAYQEKEQAYQPDQGRYPTNSSGTYHA